MNANRRAALLACIVPILAAARPAPAQQPAPPDPCEARRDSLTAKAIRKYGHHAPLAATLAAFVVAPSVLLLSPSVCAADDEQLGYWRDHVSAYATGGAMFNTSGGAAAQSAGVEALVRGVFAEARVDRYHLSNRVEMRDVRAGYLFHPARGIAGGVTAGWRDVSGAPDGWSGGGVLIGFPIIIAACEDRTPCWLQWEPIYMISGRGIGFTPRLRMELPLARTPLLARLDLEAKGMKGEDPMSVTLGFRLRP